MRKVCLYLVLSLLVIGLGVSINYDPQIMKSFNTEDYVTVNIVFKDNSRFSTMNLPFESKSVFSKDNILSAKLTKSELNQLLLDDSIESIEQDVTMYALLDSSAGVIDADRVWNLSYSGSNITGTNTVCVVDTGINYEHPAFGSCDPLNLTITGNNDTLGSAVESAHNYADLYDNNWTITQAGYTNISVYFEKLYTEPYWDYVYLYDENDTLIETYQGEYQYFWSTAVPGDTVKIRLVSDEAVNHYGFKITKTLNGSAVYDYNWSGCSQLVGAHNMMSNDTNVEAYINDHGTHVSGTIVSTNSTYRGISDGASVYLVKALEDTLAGSGSLTTISKAIEHCIQKKDVFNITAISMSLGTSAPTLFSSYCDASYGTMAGFINDAVVNNISVFVASGNDGNNTHISSPACIENSTAIGASTDADVVASYSNHATIIDLIAPGSAITAPSFNTGFSTHQGTSMATPHVAAASALLYQFGIIELGNLLTPSQIVSALKDTGFNITLNNITKPRINVYSALLSLDTMSPTVSYISPTPENQSSVGNNTNISIRINSTEMLNNVTLHFNSINYLMNRSGLEWYYNLTVESNTTFNITGKDLANNTFITETRITQLNVVPEILTKYPNLININILEPNNQTFNITFNDTDGDAINITWYLGGVLQSQGINNSEWNHTGNYTSAGDYNVTVSLFDGVATISNYWNLSINNTNRAPNISVYAPLSFHINLSENVSLQFNHTSSDDDVDDVLNYSWLVDDVLVNSSQNFSYTPSFNLTNMSSPERIVNVSLVVNDSYEVDIQSWNVTVKNVNRVPTLVNFSILPLEPVRSDNLTCNFNYSDPDNDSMNFSIIRWFVNETVMSIFENETTINSTNTSRFQNWTCEVTVSDSNVSYVENSTIQVLNSVPNIETFSPTGVSKTIDEPDSQTFSISVNDLENDNLSIYWYLDGVLSATNSSEYTFSGGYSTSGTYVVLVNISDDYNQTKQNWTLIVNDVSETTSSPGGSSGTSPSLPVEDEDVEENNIEETTIASVSEGELLEVGFSTEITDVSSISIISESYAENVIISSEKLTEKPTSVSTPSSTVYSYLDIKVENVNVSSAEIDFVINKSWIEENNLDKNTISLLRYTTNWVALETSIVSETETSIELTALTSGFSYFAIIAEEKELVEEQNITKPNTTITGAVTNSEPNVTITGENEDSSWKNLVKKLNLVKNSVLLFTLLAVIIIVSLLLIGKVLLKRR